MIEKIGDDGEKYRNQQDTMEHNNDTGPHSVCSYLLCVSLGQWMCHVTH